MPSAQNIFTFDWDADVPDEVRDRLFDKIVWAVRRWRVELPVILILETAAPLSHLAGQSVIVAAPLLAALLPGGITDVQCISKLLESPSHVQHLIDRIQEEGTHGTRQ